MAPLILYYFPQSGPSRMALSVVRCLGIDVELRSINLYLKEQLKEEYIKINPQHTVPTLVDDGFVLTESRAIAIYLIEKYFPDGHPLYPNDVKQRALINQRLQFDCGTLYPRIKTIQWQTVYANRTQISDEARQNLFKALDLLNIFLNGNKYVTGSDQPTLADVVIFVSIANVVELGGDLNKYPNIATWFERCKELPSTADNLAGAKILGDKFRSITQDKIHV